jgi:spectinomycin phosphotransferase
MLEKPAIPEEKICDCMQAEFGLQTGQIDFLPLGADLNTAVYRLLGKDGRHYFLKLRRGSFREISVTLPKFLGEQGITEVIVPLKTRSGKLWANLEATTVLLYPFVEGRNGYERNLAESQWVELGQAFKRIHSVELPKRLSRQIRRENYSPDYRLALQSILESSVEEGYSEPLSIKLAGLLEEYGKITRDLLQQAEQLAQSVKEPPTEFCLCHADLHAGNILIDAEGRIHLVDWDDPILAVKERDLMSIGASLFGNWRLPQEEEMLFYEGYGQVQINQAALAYYRCERVIEDLAIECRQIFSKTGSIEEREQALEFFESNFLPNHTIELALKTPVA